MPMMAEIFAAVRSIMMEDRRYSFLSYATILFTLSLPYRIATRFRILAYSKGWLRRKRLNCPAVSIGNLTTGGTGKTPMTVFCARLAVKLGMKPAIVSRGYKGSYRSETVVVSDGNTLLADAALSGDEPYLMAAILKHIPVVAGRDRYTAGKMAIARFQPDLLLLDDGFQHMRLYRDLDLLLLDATRPFGNGHLLPRGMLREPISALSRADAVFLTRCDSPSPKRKEIADMVRPRPIFSATHYPVLRGVIPAYTVCDNRVFFNYAEEHGKQDGSKFFVFSGLARNDLFLASLEKCRYAIIGSADFDDHHAYSLEDINRIVTQARQIGAEFLVTTDKDYVRIPRNTTLPMPLMIFGVDMKVFGGEFETFFADRLRNIALKKRNSV